MKRYNFITFELQNNILLSNRELSDFTVLQLLILRNGNNFYRRFNLPFAVSILFKTLQVLTALVTHSGLVYIFILYFVRRPHNEVMGSAEHFQICW
jgi:hypothetical protein